MKEKYTVVLSKFEGLKEFLEGNKTVSELNERVFNNGFIPIEYQEQIGTKIGHVFVIHGIGNEEFQDIEFDRIKNNIYDTGWTLFLSGPYKKAIYLRES